jgi:hypothetical protein
MILLIFLSISHFLSPTITWSSFSLNSYGSSDYKAVPCIGKNSLLVYGCFLHYLEKKEAHRHSWSKPLYRIQKLENSRVVFCHGGKQEFVQCFNQKMS